MKKLITILLLISLITITAFGLTGELSPNSLFYKPGYGEFGESAYNQYNTYIDIADAQIEANRTAISDENIEDIAGAMSTSNTETFISVDYQDGDGTIDYVVPVKDEDNMASDSDVFLVTQQSIKAYVDGTGETVLTIKVKEENTSGIVKGQPVYVSGATGNAFPKVGLADTDDAAKYEVIGLAAEAITQNQTGLVRIGGLLEGIDTLGANAVNPDNETWMAGDLLYLHTTAGGLTKTEPTVGRVVEVGYSLFGSSNTDAILLMIHAPHIHIEVSAGEDIELRMGDSAGANKVIFKGYDNVEVASVDSNGKADFNELILDVELADSEISDTLTASNLVPAQEIDIGAHSVGFTLQTATGDGTTTIDWRLGNKFQFTFGAQNDTFTFTAPSNPGTLMLTVIQDGTGSRTITWPGTVKWAGGVAPTLTTAGGSRDKIALDWDGTQYDAVASLDFK